MDWIHQNATAVIAACSALCSAFIAGGFALLGAWLNNRQNFQRQKQLFDQESQKESRKHLSEKGEELYVLLSKWSKAVSTYQLNLMRIAKGVLTKEQVNEMTLKLEIDYDPNRMSCLLNIYFPDLVPEFVIVDKARSRAVKIGHAYDHKKITAEACLDGVDEAASLFDQSMEHLLNELTKDIIKKIN